MTIKLIKINKNIVIIIITIIILLLTVWVLQTDYLCLTLLKPSDKPHHKALDCI
jgi:hypothetical protein